MIIFCCFAECEILRKTVIKWPQTSEQASDILAIRGPYCHPSTEENSKGNCQDLELSLGRTYGLYVRHNCHSLFAKPQEDSYKRTGLVLALVQLTSQAGVFRGARISSLLNREQHSFLFVLFPWQLLEVIKLSQCFMQIEYLSSYPAVKVGLPEFRRYNVIG